MALSCIRGGCIDSVRMYLLDLTWGLGWWCRGRIKGTQGEGGGGGAPGESVRAEVSSVCANIFVGTRCGIIL